MTDVCFTPGSGGYLHEESDRRRSRCSVELKELSFPSQSMSKEGSLPFLLIFHIVNPAHCFRCRMSSGHVSYFKPSTRGWAVQRAQALLYSEPQETLPTFLVPDLKKKKKSYMLGSLWFHYGCFCTAVVWVLPGLGK